VDRFQVGGSLKHAFGGSTLSASLSGGIGDASLSRQVVAPGGPLTANGDPDGSWIAAHARADHVLTLSKTSYLKPWLDIGLQRFLQSGFTERGAGDFGLRVDAVGATLVSVQPRLEFGGAFAVGGAQANATLSGGMLALFGDTDHATTVRLAGVGPDGPGFTVTDSLDDLYATIGGHLEVRSSRSITLRADVDALLGDSQRTYAASAKVMWSF